MGILEGKVALVTGAGAGLGRCHALALAREGASVVVNDLGIARDGTGEGDRSAAQAVADEICAAGGTAVADAGSVTDEQAVADMIAKATGSFGGLDILVANAGILRDKSFKKMTREEWDSVLAVHLHGTYLTVRAAYQHMLAQGRGGRLVVTSSTSGLFGNFGQCNYGAAKAGIAGLARCLWPEALRAGITVNTLCPAALTRLTEDLPRFGGPGGYGEQMQPEQVSPTVVWLCSDAAAEITGRQFLVYGNTVKLIEPCTIPIAERDAPWTPEEIGAHILATVQERAQPAWIELQ